MDLAAVISRFVSDWKRRQGCIAFREVLVTQVKEVLRAWLSGVAERRTYVKRWRTPDREVT